MPIPEAALLTAVHIGESPACATAMVTEILDSFVEFRFWRVEGAVGSLQEGPWPGTEKRSLPHLKATLLTVCKPMKFGGRHYTIWQGYNRSHWLIKTTKALLSFSACSACMRHIPSKLVIKGEQRIYPISGFLHQSDYILSFPQISKDACMAQNQPKNYSEKWESFFTAAK